ncbi:MAG: hypothetical protein CMC98_05225 [Flavobacteriales bacterium]|nr:hypothetical protein [Flavobacteriales bacterium]
MKARKIALLLIPLNILLIYLVYNSINSEMIFNKAAKERISNNVQKLKDLRQLQVKYKQTYGEYSDNFEKLDYFLRFEKIVTVKAIGETPDSLTDAQALELGIISRDTTYALAKESVFDKTYLNNRKKDFPLDIDNLFSIPYTEEKYNISAGEIEKGNVTVQVFEISTNYGTVFNGLDAKNKNYELDALLKVGSMDEASLNGNWKSE